MSFEPFQCVGFPDVIGKGIPESGSSGLKGMIMVAKLPEVEFEADILYPFCRHPLFQGESSNSTLKVINESHCVYVNVW